MPARALCTTGGVRSTDTLFWSGIACGVTGLVLVIGFLELRRSRLLAAQAESASAAASVDLSRGRPETASSCSCADHAPQYGARRARAPWRSGRRRKKRWDPLLNELDGVKEDEDEEQAADELMNELQGMDDERRDSAGGDNDDDKFELAVVARSSTKSSIADDGGSKNAAEYDSSDDDEEVEPSPAVLRKLREHHMQAALRGATGRSRSELPTQGHARTLMSEAREMEGGNRQLQALAPKPAAQALDGELD